MTNGKMQVKVAEGLTELTQRASRTLLETGLESILREVDERLCRSKRMVTVTSSTDNSIVIGIEPFAELTLWQTMDIARSTRSPSKKQAMVRNLLNMAGY